MPKIGSLAKAVVATHCNIRLALAAQGLNAHAKIRTVRKPNSQDFACIVGTSLVVLQQQNKPPVLFTTVAAVLPNPTYDSLYRIYGNALYCSSAGTLVDLLWDAYAIPKHTKSVYDIVLECWRRGYSLVGRNQINEMINDGLLESSDVLDAISAVTNDYVKIVTGKDNMAVSIHHKKFKGIVYGSSKPQEKPQELSKQPRQPRKTKEVTNASTSPLDS